MVLINDMMLGIIGFVYGTIFASFFTLVAYRLPLGNSIVNPPSHCDNCQHQLHLLDLVPILSYLWNRGRCHYCGIKYGSTHLWFELFIGLGFGLSCYFLYSEWILLFMVLILLCFVNVELVMTLAYKKLNIRTKIVGYSISLLFILAVGITVGFTSLTFYLLTFGIILYLISITLNIQNINLIALFRVILIIAILTTLCI